MNDWWVRARQYVSCCARVRFSGVAAASHARASTPRRREEDKEERKHIKPAENRENQVISLLAVRWQPLDSFILVLRSYTILLPTLSLLLLFLLLLLLLLILILFLLPADELIFGAELGRGAFGVVMRATLRATGETVAVKQLLEQADAAAVESFLLEARLMSFKPHPNIVALRGLCTQHTPMFMVLEFMPLGNLRDYLRNCRPRANPRLAELTTADTVAYSLQIAQAMTYLASAHIVHRDIAARNILVQSRHVVKLADFGP